MKKISNLNQLLHHIHSNDYFLVGPKINLNQFSIIPHLKKGTLKIVLDAYALVSTTGWSRANLLYAYSLFVKEIMKNNIQIYLYNSKNKDKNCILYRNRKELEHIGKLIGIKNKQQILI